MCTYMHQKERNLQCAFLGYIEPSSSQPRIETTLSRTITSQSKLLTRRSPSVTLRKNAQTTCRDLQYRCQNGRCIFHTNQCDGDDDCGDYSDEVHCAYQRRWFLFLYDYVVICILCCPHVGAFFTGLTNIFKNY